jgi:hypothetical protein
MAKSQETYSKKEKEKKKIAQRKEKEEKKLERKANAVKGGLDTMMAYVDEYGNITDTPPDPTKKLVFNAEDMQLGATKIETVAEEPNRTGTVTFFNYASGYTLNATTAAVFRDPSAWYHIVLAIDTTQATSSNGIKLYVNGTLQTLTIPTYTQNYAPLSNVRKSYLNYESKYIEYYIKRRYIVLISTFNLVYFYHRSYR